MGGGNGGKAVAKRGANDEDRARRWRAFAIRPHCKFPADWRGPVQMKIRFSILPP